MHHILCGSPLISRDFYAIRPLNLWHILGSYFLLLWGVGVVRIIFRVVFWVGRHLPSRTGRIGASHKRPSYQPRIPIAHLKPFGKRCPKEPPGESERRKNNINITFPRSWYRAQKPLKPGNTKKIRKICAKKYEIPHPGSGPENTKKIQKKYENGHFWAVFAFFLYFCLSFRGPTRVGDFVISSYFFRISGLEGFLSSIPGTRNHNINITFQAGYPAGEPLEKRPFPGPQKLMLGLVLLNKTQGIPNVHFSKHKLLAPPPTTGFPNSVC